MRCLGKVNIQQSEDRYRVQVEAQCDDKAALLDWFEHYQKCYPYNAYMTVLKEQRDEPGNFVIKLERLASCD